MNCNKLTDKQYNEKLDKLMLAIEDAIDNSGIDIDYESTAGILTLTCENNTAGNRFDSKIILSRQTPLQQLWLASRSGGYHFRYETETREWVLSSETNGFSKGMLFIDLLNQCLSEQTGETVKLTIQT